MRDMKGGMWIDRLDAAVARVQNPCLLGLDPHLDLLPGEFAVARDPRAARAERAGAVERFCLELLDVAAGRVAAVKPQSAFFEVLGADGVRAWENVVAAARARGLLVIGDVKRSDIASTAAAYAQAFLGGAPGLDPSHLCDAITVSPYLGPDSLAPFLTAGRETRTGIYVLVRTSNAGGGEYQRHGEPALCEKIAAAVAAWGEDFRGECGLAAVGAVVGATHPAELRRMRDLMPRTPLLLPGYGAQGATARDVAAAFSDPAHPWRGALVNSSRGIAFAWRAPEHASRSWKDAARAALDAMIADVRHALARP
ncbi:MAG: orotidine-5'-phosphate decarboxylase [Planctomycetota bacterium]